MTDLGADRMIILKRISNKRSVWACERIRWLVDGLSWWRPIFDPRSVYVRFVNKAGMELVFFEYFCFLSALQCTRISFTYR